MADTRLEPLVLSEAERRALGNWAKRRTTVQKLALRARMVLARPLPKPEGSWRACERDHRPHMA